LAKEKTKPPNKEANGKVRLIAPSHLKITLGTQSMMRAPKLVKIR